WRFMKRVMRKADDLACALDHLTTLVTTEAIGIDFELFPMMGKFLSLPGVAPLKGVDKMERRALYECTSFLEVRTMANDIGSNVANAQTAGRYMLRRVRALGKSEKQKRKMLKRGLREVLHYAIKLVQVFERQEARFMRDPSVHGVDDFMAQNICELCAMIPDLAEYVGRAKLPPICGSETPLECGSA
ncbi:MAG: hypothetical protein SGILL_005086, partial [Bacillariaceae sp.]